MKETWWAQAVVGRLVPWASLEVLLSHQKDLRAFRRSMAGGVLAPVVGTTRFGLIMFFEEMGSNPNLTLIILSFIMFIVGVAIILFRDPLGKLMTRGLASMYGDKAKYLKGKGMSYNLLWSGGGAIAFSLLLLFGGIFIPPSMF